MTIMMNAIMMNMTMILSVKWTMIYLVAAIGNQKLSSLGRLGRARKLHHIIHVLDPSQLYEEINYKLAALKNGVIC